MPRGLTEEQKQHIEQWCQALESGKFRQMPGALFDDGYFCVLGVACEISGLGDWEDGCYVIGEGEDRITASDFLPEPVFNWLGLAQNPILKPVRDLGTANADGVPATELNDDYSVPFPELAAAIRKTYLDANCPPELKTEAHCPRCGFPIGAEQFGGPPDDPIRDEICGQCVDELWQEANNA